MPFSRRHFFQATGAAALGGAAFAQNPPRQRSANDRIQVACIGFGIMGQGDVQTAVALPGVELVGVADVYEGRLTLAKERYGNQVFTTRDYREVLARPGVDAVIVATPDHWHARQAVDAMNAGKDVYCQKPMVWKVEEGHAVIEAEKRNKRILQVGSQRVSSVLYAKARDLIRSGAIGDVHMIEAFWDRNSPMGAWQYTVPPDATPANIDWDRFLGSAPKRPFEPIRLFRWRNYQDYGTGIAGDLFVHQFSGIHFVMDSLGPRRVVGMGGTYFWKDGRDVPDLMMGMYEYPKTDSHPGFQINLRVNFESGGAGGADSQGFRFVGTDGILNLSVGNALVLSRQPRNSDPGHTANTFSKETARQIVEQYRSKHGQGDREMRSTVEERFPLPRGYSEQVEHHRVFFDSVRSRKPVVEDATFGLRAAGPALLSNVSYFEGRIIDWDPVSMRIRTSS